MVQKINLLLEQKHLFNEIDLFIYSTFLQENEIDELLKIYNLKETNLENLLNSQQKKKKKIDKKSFINYLNFREQIREKEREFFLKFSGLSKKSLRWKCPEMSRLPLNL